MNFSRGRLSVLMGVGETVVLSALIHANRDPEPILPDDASRDLVCARQLKLDNGFLSKAL
jgi:DNA repair protein RAD5